ncbi:sucrose non-fermenting [Spathaspora passalidarum NRRL Y-27907]|uniref:Vacuolar-sorting protein SNF8 n=1 Tax=Spathaspora passalidarum (strain NRRL Y-27907 / 11-Y1) TaxID=619300 RepID=G3APA8_SPAPN|nr:sucrose non-fermenting [Spathaspora passalidarum NRRL Y-27907]EGW32085.1 sucrose non-fermenting [Spathaspora passalidarum NRRL Y-27907]
MNHNDNRDAYSQLGKSLIQRHSDQLSTQLAVFQSALVNFANSHGDEIKSNAEFRNKFTQISQSIGLDPLELLLSTTKNTKSSNFHVALAVRIVEVCQSTRDLNGGLISLKELKSILQDTHNISIEVSEGDIEQALGMLDTLGKGYQVLTINDKKWLKFTSANGDGISQDEKKVYELCGFMGGYVTYRLLRDNYGWDKVRCKTVIEEMIMNGFLWVDNQGSKGELQFWEPSWISN